jgi:hypothetical protein
MMFCIIFRRFRKIVESDHYRPHVCALVCPSVWNNSTATGRIFMEFDMLGSSESLSRKVQVLLKSDKNKGTLVKTSVNL